MKMCSSLNQLGHDIELFAQEDRSESVEDLFGYYGIDKEFKISFMYRPNIKLIGSHIYAHLIRKKVLSKGLPDLFYGRDFYSLLAIRNLGVPLILELHTIPSNLYARNAIKKIAQSKNLKAVVVTAESLKFEYEKLYPWIEKSKIILLRNGADVPLLVKGSKDTCGRIGYVGHLYPGKGMEIIIEIAKQVENEFHIIGGTEDDIRRWKKEVKSGNVFFHGYIPNGQLSSYYAMFDIVLAPYQSLKVSLGKDGKKIDKWASPLKIIEYMSYKKAIIASDLPMVREVLKDGENGFLCRVDDIDSWVNKITELSTNNTLKMEISEKAHSDFLQNYTWEQRAKSLIDISTQNMGEL
jgi:glycosyltransferase involved in cell wall biosynthesis